MPFSYERTGKLVQTPDYSPTLIPTKAMSAVVIHRNKQPSLSYLHRKSAAILARSFLGAMDALVNKPFAPVIFHG
jgi:hypothetical protein